MKSRSLLLFLLLLCVAGAAMAERYAKLSAQNNSTQKVLFEVVYPEGHSKAGKVQKQEAVGADGTHPFTFSFDECKHDHSKTRIVRVTPNGESEPIGEITVTMAVSPDGNGCDRSYRFSDNTASKKSPVCRGTGDGAFLYYLEKQVASDKKSGAVALESHANPLGCP